MNRSTLYKQLKCITRYLKASGVNRCVNQQQYVSTLSSNSKLSVKEKFKSISALATNRRNVSSSNLTKSDAKSNEPSTDERTPNLTDDEEFHNILKDFAKDFGLDSESEKMLEDIKHSLDQPETGEVSPSREKDATSSAESVGAYGITEKFKEFSESDSVVIPSNEELVSGAYNNEELTYHIDQNWKSDTSQIEYKRGISGVYDIGELVDVLHKENLADIAVISVPKELHYTDFLVIATAMSPRHSKAVAEFVNKIYKMKKHEKDPFIKVEGENVSNWKALDMGNIVLHIFLEETRAFYDIESLWLFDQDYDSGGTLKSDPVFDALKEQIAFFNSLQNSTGIQTSSETTHKA